MSKFMMDRGQEYVANEFVVAAAHRDLVMNELDGTGASAGRPDPDLDLALVTLPDPAAAAEKLRRRGAPDGTPTAADPLPLDTVLAELRALFANRYGGWEPTLGKNRVMKGVQFFPYPSFGGDDMPTASAGKTPVEPATGAPDRDAGHRARVVVLDTGIYPLDTLAGRYLARSSSVLRNHPDVRQWWEGHATFISGLILGRAPAAELEIRSILQDEGRADVWKVAQNLVRYADSGADVLTAAFGCFTVDGKPPLVLERAIARLTPTVVVVAAAGNYGAGPADSADRDSLPQPKTPIWPAAFESVVAVGAADENGKPADFSPRVPWVDLVAPGVKVSSDFLEGDVQVLLTDEKTGERREEVRRFDGTAVWSGTSFAAAAVTGAVAAQTVRGRRTAYEALDRVRRGIGGASRHGIDVATFS